uniref:Flavin-containing monooxygenase n=1 Tax=Arundo donax TaxID=35708 RepID=A0A0A9GME7_ARUDO
MHSHSYRVPDPFAHQVVVIIGAKNSGGDISREIASVAREVHMVNRSSPAATCERLPSYHNLWLRSMVDRAEEDGSVVFRDGTSIKADVIMHCTGYKYSFPFLDDDDCSIISIDDNRIHPLYKHVFPPQAAPHLSFIGLPFKVVPFPLFQLQSNWVAGVLSGRLQLPSEKEMMEDVRALYSEIEAIGWPRRYTHCLKYNQNCVSV